MINCFLQYVAADLYNKFGNDMSRVAVVFPNKRASLYLKEYLAALSDKPLWSPVCMTISDLFRRHSYLTVADDIKLVCELHKSSNLCTGNDETLDHFYGWGQLLLSDFDDIDKNLVDAKQVFTNTSNLHELDDISYLTDEQKAVFQKFFIDVNSSNDSKLVQYFLELWRHLGDIYTDFNERLLSQSLAYEGALYRQVANDDNAVFDMEHYAFVGFNMLHASERKLFMRLKDESKALFYWDFDTYYMPDADGTTTEAGTYISQYMQIFPNELEFSESIYSNFKNKKSITFISAATNNIQARYVTTWLKQNNHYAAGRRTAVVMCDENLLPTVIYSIAEEAEKANITSGYPLKMTTAASLVDSLIDLRTEGLNNDTLRYGFNYVDRVLRHPLIKYISEKAASLRANLKLNGIRRPNLEELSLDDDLGSLFALPACDATSCDAGTENKNNQKAYNIDLIEWMMRVVKTIALNSKDEGDELLKESLFQVYTVFSRLLTLSEQDDLDVNTLTLRRLIKQLIGSTSIPFHGELAVGVQIMGVLETRNLDFENILLLSCNEGNMPKGVNDSSYIPYSIRKSFGLTTIDNKVAIYSYYFYRLLQRATDITLLFNNSTTDGQKGEMSRFMLQLMVESPHKIKHERLLAEHSISHERQQKIGKNNAVMQCLLEMGEISPTAINKYLRCPLQFYYNYIAKIKEPYRDAEEGIDNRMFGDIFHNSACFLYQEIKDENSIVSKEKLEQVLKNPQQIDRVVDRALRKELFNDETKQCEIDGLQMIHKKVVTEYIRKLVEYDISNAPIKIIGLEEQSCLEVEINVDGEPHSINISGTFDRLDVIDIPEEGTRRIRVIDYKTGSPINSIPQTTSDIFQSENIKKFHSDYFLQAILYSIIVSKSKELNPDDLDVSPELIFVKSTKKNNYDPMLKIKDIGPIYDVRAIADEFMSLLKKKLEEIFDKSTPFCATSDKEICNQCPYINICKANCKAS